MSSRSLASAAICILQDSLQVQPSESVVIIVDQNDDHQQLGETLFAGAQKLGCDPVLIVMSPNSARGSEPSAPVAEAMKAADVCIAPCQPSLSHTQARKQASETGTRIITMPGATVEMVTRMMNADLHRINTRSKAVANYLTAGKTAHVTCPLGTNILMNIAGREAIADTTERQEAKAFGNLPAGEGFISPIAGDGVIFATSLADVGLAQEPVELTVKNGRLVSASGDLGTQFLALLDTHGPLGRNLAELGVGTHDAAQITGNILEDEKVLGTAHIAFGASAGIGGDVVIPIHLDVVVDKAKVEIDGVELKVTT